MLKNKYMKVQQILKNKYMKVQQMIFKNIHKKIDF